MKEVQISLNQLIDLLKKSECFGINMDLTDLIKL